MSTHCKFDMDNLDLECVGHAAEEDNDKGICVALTTLVLTLAYDVEESASMCEEKDIKIEPGYYHIRVKPIEGAREQMEFLFGAFVNGIYMLSEDPKIKEHITLEVISNEV